MGTRTIEIIAGRSIKPIPANIRLTGVLLSDERLQYKLDADRRLLTRMPVTGEVTVTYEKTTFKQPIDVAAYWPLTPTEPTKS